MVILKEILMTLMGYVVVLLLLAVGALIYLLRNYYVTEDHRVIHIAEYKELQIRNAAMKKTKVLAEREQRKLEQELLDLQRELELMRE